VVSGFEEVGIGANLALARQVTKTHSGGVKGRPTLGACSPRTRAIWGGELMNGQMRNAE
jgi:hypothetical protein